MKPIVEFRAELLPDSRVRVTINNTAHPQSAYNPSTYITVKNIDGSNRLMRDNGGWDFLPREYEYGAGAALSKARGTKFPFPNCIPEHHVVL